MTSKKIFVIAGEASGDLHGASLIRQIRSRAKEPVTVYGVGGEHIRKTGALEFFDLAHFHVTGVTQAIRRFPQYRKAASVILSRIKKTTPDLVVLIDNPGFNLHLAKKIHALNIPIVYYIAPQVWAWAPKRILTIKKYVKKVLVVFQFEEKLYRDHGIPVSWVGHPLKDLIVPVSVPETPGVPEGKNRLSISLLPGSRKGELKMLLPVFLGVARILEKNLENVSFMLIKAPTMPQTLYRRMLEKEAVAVRLVEQDPYRTIRESDLAIVCSGTATLECALLGTPMIISNRGSWLTYLTAKMLIRVPHLGLPNLVLGESKIPELLQYEATPEKIAQEALRILKDEPLRQTMKKNLQKVSQMLGEGGASEKAAAQILEMVSPG